MILEISEVKAAPEIVRIAEGANRKDSHGGGGVCMAVVVIVKKIESV
jgi:hypothetical protein